MKTIILIYSILVFSVGNAQDNTVTNVFFDLDKKMAFTNTILANKDKQVVNIENYVPGYRYRLPKVEFELHPNPVYTGEYVSIRPTVLGEEVSVFEPTGAFVKSYTMDVDKRINTIDLKKGEYLVRTRDTQLKLVVK